MEQISFRVGSTERMAYRSPRQMDLCKRLIIGLHGTGGHPLLMNRASRLEAAFPQDTEIIYLAAQRQGRLTRWDWSSGADHDFISVVIEKYLSQDIHNNQVFIVGVSNGGCFGQLYASRSIVSIGGFAAISSGFPAEIDATEQENTNQPASIRKIVLVNSIGDPIVPYNGGGIESDNGLFVRSHSEGFNYWINRLSAKEASISEKNIARLIFSTENIEYKYYVGMGSDKSELLSVSVRSRCHGWDLLDSPSEESGRSLGRTARRRGNGISLERSRVPRVSELIREFLISS